MSDESTRRLVMWSGPRNISTAMMRAFENRPDCAVWDEPFYAAYLTHSGVVHPMQEDIIADGLSQPSDVECAAGPCARRRPALLSKAHDASHDPGHAPRLV